MSLTKPYQYTYVPGTAEVPYVAEYTVCQQTESGYWDYVCTQEDVTDLWRTYGSISVSKPSTLEFEYDEEDNVTAVYIKTCASVWVSEPSSGNIVCTTYPEQAHVDAVPATIEVTAQAAWDAGANSIDSQDSDCEVAFTMAAVIGVIVGLTADLEGVTETDRLTHALYFHQTAAAQPVYSIIESGVTARAAEEYSPDDTWAIRRTGTLVGYYRNGQRIMNSAVPSSGTLNVGSALYYSGDTIE